MPTAASILEHLSNVVEQAMGISPFVRLILVGLIVVCVVRRRVYAEYLAGYIGLLLVGAAVVAIAFEKSQDLVTFFALFPLGMLWGREALVLPPRPRPGALRIALASLFGLAAFFYPHFVTGASGAILFAPLGIIPCPTLLLALSGVMLAKRAYTLYAVIPTLAAAAFFGAVGVFYLDVAVDWALLAAVPAAALSYVFAPKQESRPKGKRFKRKH